MPWRYPDLQRRRRADAGYAAAEVMNKFTPADISDSEELIARASALSVELGTTITPGFDALVFKASHGIEDIYELTYIRKDGSRFPAIVSVTALRDAQDAIIGYLLIGTDNTARKRAEQDLSEKARLLDLSNDAIIVRDLDGKISSWNKGAEKLYGWASKEAIGKQIDSLLQTEFPKPMEEILAQLQGEGEFSGELVQIIRDGRRVAVLCRWVLDRGTKSILTSYTDITERRMLEDALAARASDLVRADR